ncbi:hypothetical protein ID0093_01590 [Helicobacter pylori]
MLLNYDFLEFVDEPQRNTSLTASIDKALADRKADYLLGLSLRLDLLKTLFIKTLPKKNKTL